MKLYQLFLKTGLILCIGLLNLSVDAQTSADYQGQVSVASHAPADWDKALAPALLQVLQKVSGNPNIADKVAIKQGLAQAGNYVQSFNYITGTNPPLSLQIRFSPKAVDNLLHSINQAQEGDVLPTATANAVTSQVNVTVVGIKGLDDYAALTNYLRGLTSVASVDVNQTSNDKTVLLVGLRFDQTALVKELSQGNQLGVITADNSDAGLTYRWNGTNNLPAPSAAPISNTTSAVNLDAGKANAIPEEVSP